LRYGHSIRDQTGAVWSFPRRREQPSEVGGGEGDQGNWMGMGMDRMKVPNWEASSGPLTDRNSEGESRSLCLLICIPL
jgi:hypothetical protein